MIIESYLHAYYLGNVLVDGYNTRDLAPVWLRRNMGVVSQARNICIYGLESDGQIKFENEANTSLNLEKNMTLIQDLDRRNSLVFIGLQS